MCVYIYIYVCIYTYISCDLYNILFLLDGRFSLNDQPQFCLHITYSLLLLLQLLLQLLQLLLQPTTVYTAHPTAFKL